MKKYDLKIIELRYGMAAPIWYFRIAFLVIMWWGWKNGKIEITTTSNAEISGVAKHPLD